MGDIREMAIPIPASARQISNGTGVVQNPEPILAAIEMMKPVHQSSFGPLFPSSARSSHTTRADCEE